MTSVLPSMTTSTTPYKRNEAGLYVCSECGETKNRPNTLFYHMKKHAGALDHVCPHQGCGKRFVQKSGLTQHLAQAHATGEPDVGCPCCEHRCRTKANLLIHIARKHGADWVPPRADTGECAGCQRNYASDTAYYYHAAQCFAAKAPEAIRVGLNMDATKKL
jgi:hypothetical protein